MLRCSIVLVFQCYFIRGFPCISVSYFNEKQYLGSKVYIIVGYFSFIQLVIERDWNLLEVSSNKSFVNLFYKVPFFDAWLLNEANQI